MMPSGDFLQDLRLPVRLGEAEGHEIGLPGAVAIGDLEA
jgi:hypothetical protein